MKSLARRRIWYVAPRIALSAGVAPEQSWKQVILQSSAKDLDNVRSRFGVAVAVPGYYLLSVPSSVDTQKITPPDKAEIKERELKQSVQCVPFVGPEE